MLLREEMLQVQSASMHNMIKPQLIQKHSPLSADRQTVCDDCKLKLCCRFDNHGVCTATLSELIESEHSVDVRFEAELVTAWHCLDQMSCLSYPSSQQSGMCSEQFSDGGPTWQGPDGQGSHKSSCL